MDNTQVKAALASLAARDPQLGEELHRQLMEGAPEAALVAEGLRRAGPVFTPETIVLRNGRPVLAIRDDTAQLEIDDAQSQVWRQRLRDAQAVLTAPIRGVGRIELDGHPDFSWVGTGWLVKEDVIVTNRHVAREFGRRNGEEFSFRLGAGGRPMSASIDFLAEFERTARRSVALREILHIEDEDGPDLAFLRIGGDGLAEPIPLAAHGAREAQLVAVVGYPARDSRIPEQDLMDRLFGNVYDRKRLAPGQVIAVNGAELQHDCSTLGGNSGSVILDLASGAALGVHFAGRFLQANYAVPADVVQERLHAAERRATRPPPAPPAGAGATVVTNPLVLGGRRIECTIPIRLSIELAEPVVAGIGGADGMGAATAPWPQGPAGSGEPDDDALAAEGVPQDYLDRRGFSPGFLGRGVDVPMPRITRDAQRVLSFEFDGNPDESVLRYHHFSVVMHRERRMCLFSAVNIDGNRSRKTRRPAWRRDPRIPREQQIVDECYGDPPKFSRGHMTRREDPAWGTAADAQRGNADSMHVTNAVPQMQAFNAGIWLGLEDYALENARDDDMKICVFTGPVFRPSDPIRFGVRIPVTFWKVIAFIHDRTRRLSATGYSMSQRRFLGPEEFVFGAYETHQRSLRWIEQQAGLSFGPLTAEDRFDDSEEALQRPLADPRQIRWA